MVQKRAAVLHVLQESEGHLCAEEIFERVKEYYPNLVRATVYNNLHALTESGHVKHIRTASGADYYDKTTSPHEHAVCAGCGKLFDADIDNFHTLLQAQTKLNVLGYDLILHTLCPDCEAEKQKNA